jgi:hypothetical protein
MHHVVLSLKTPNMKIHDVENVTKSMIYAPTLQRGTHPDSSSTPKKMTGEKNWPIFRAK